MIVKDVIVVEVRISQHIYNAVNSKYLVNSDSNGKILFLHAKPQSKTKQLKRRFCKKTNQSYSTNPLKPIDQHNRT